MKNELQYKLTNYEATPPAHMWAEIESALEDQLAPHAEVLYQFQQVPPPSAWNKIQESLHGTPFVTESVIANRKVSFMRYAAAAALLILIASAITMIVNRNHSNEIADQHSPEIFNPDSNRSVTDENNTKENESIEIPKRNESQKSSPVISNKLNTKEKATGRYLTMADEKGKKVRLSKKVAPVFDCADEAASLKSMRCKESIESLQQKMSTSLLSSTGDFSGLIDMIKSLEEKN